jgi:iron complex outermembrane receptor protein
MGRCWPMLACLAGALAGAAPAVADESAAVEKNDAQPWPAIEEIVVTARKREESLQTVPLSVAAVSGEELERRSVDSLGDLSQFTPNFTFSQTPNGGSAAGVAFIRGVGQLDAHSAYDPAVGIYIDGVYFGRMYGNNFDMLDVERVEVLRGPQGTLFGKNTSGGAISVVTRAPDLAADDMSGRVQLTGGSRDRLNALASVNIPLIADRLAVQIAGSRQKQDGYGKRLDGQEMANTDREAARVQLLFRPVEKFSALLAADWMQFDEANASYKLLDTNPLAGPVAAYNANVDPDYDDRWVSQKDYFFNGAGPNSARGDVWGSSLTLTWDAAFATFKSISAYRASDIHSDVDPDGAPIVIINKFEHAEQDQLSQELQASGSWGRLEWVGGVYYFREKIDSLDSFNLLPALFGVTRDFSRVIPVENRSHAAYGQGTYRVTDRARVTAGLRYTRDEKRIQASQLNYLGAVQYATPDSEHSSSAVSPRIGLDYQWTPQVMTYISAAQGAKNGGYNGRPSRLSDFTEFDDETVWTYEVGLRSDLFDGRARFNATAFYSDYTDMQVTISGSVTVNNAPAPFSLITNIPKVEITGGEVELIVAPAQGLTLSGGLGLTYGKYTELPTDAQFIAAGLLDEDNEIPNVPEVAFTLAAQYNRALSDEIDLTTRVDYSHRSLTHVTSENSPLVFQPAYGLLNARLTFEHVPSGIAVSLFGANLTDEAYMLGGIDDANRPSAALGFSTINQGPPREWGISLQKRF